MQRGAGMRSLARAAIHRTGQRITLRGAKRVERRWRGEIRCARGG
jgi:hypothetical protein